MQVLSRDERLIAVAKPAGLLVHRSAVDPRAESNALSQVRDRIGQYVYPVHRLDRPTSGVLLFALDADAARAIAGAFERGEVRKTYLAVVRGHVEPQGCIDHPLREECDPATDARARDAKAAQTAVTDYRRLALAELAVPAGPHATARFSLVEATPRTGRKHQIRRHLKHISHPILGDTTHGDGRQNRFAREHLLCSRLLLHAWRLELRPDWQAGGVTIEAPLEHDFYGALERLGWKGFPTLAAG